MTPSTPEGLTDEYVRLVDAHDVAANNDGFDCNVSCVRTNSARAALDAYVLRVIRERDKLQHECEMLTKAGVIECMVRNPAVAERIAGLEAQLDAAREALRKYGRHGYYCDYARRSLVQQPCTCGLEAASQPGIAAEGAEKTGGEQHE